MRYIPPIYETTDAWDGLSDEDKDVLECGEIAALARRPALGPEDPRADSRRWGGGLTDAHAL